MNNLFGFGNFKFLGMIMLNSSRNLVENSVKFNISFVFHFLKAFAKFLYCFIKCEHKMKNPTEQNEFF